MAALTHDRNTPSRPATDFAFPMAAGADIFAGAIVVLNAFGHAEPGSEATGKIAVGRAEERRTGGAADGDEFISVSRGTFLYANATAADEIGLQHINSPCYIVDDQTVAATDGGGARSVCGTVMDVTDRGVWVKV